MAMNTKSLGYIFLSCLALVCSWPEQGIIDLEFHDTMNVGYFAKTMFNQTHIGLKIHCKTNDSSVLLSVRWALYWTNCIEELSDAQVDENIIRSSFQFTGYDNKTHKMFVSKWETLTCAEEYLTLEDRRDEIPLTFYEYLDEYDSNEFYQYDYSTEAPSESEEDSNESDATRQKSVEGEENKAGEETNAANQPTPPEGDETQQNPVASADNSGSGNARRRRAADKKEKKKSEDQGSLDPRSKKHQHIIATTNHDGPHLFALTIQSENSFTASVEVDTKGPRGYLSAVDWPLLPFYGVMSGVYLIFGVAWLAMMFMNWRDLLRVQFWIGGVILIGMLEKAVFFGEYENLNKTGRSMTGALILAEIVSAMKRSLARVLVVIVSLGFGIVKPRLGPILHKVVALGTLYFILGSIEGICRVIKDRNGRETMLATIPLAVLDAAICWWVFTSLVQVMRTLRLRRNVVKLSLYRHFTNTLIFAVLSSMVYMAWSIKEHRIVTCHTNWREIWVDDAFWHILFCIILGVIIILWRPSANNQRFAFSPLLDTAGNDDEVPEDEEKLITDAYDGMKKRSEKGVRPYRDQEETDKDLQWIDENIPTSVADGALPSLLDSDEEVVTTRYEMSKME